MRIEIIKIDNQKAWECSESTQAKEIMADINKRLEHAVATEIIQVRKKELFIVSIVK